MDIYYTVLEFTFVMYGKIYMVQLRDHSNLYKSPRQF